MYRAHVLVCGGTGCNSGGSKEIIQKLKEELKQHDLQNEISVVEEQEVEYKKTILIFARRNI